MVGSPLAQSDFMIKIQNRSRHWIFIQRKSIFSLVTSPLPNNSINALSWIGFIAINLSTVFLLTFPHITDIVCSPFALLKGNRVKLNVMNTTKVSAGSASKYDGCLQCRDGERVTTENINMQQCCFAIFLVQGCPVGNVALTSATCISAQDCTFKKAKFWKKCLPSWTNFLSLA